MSIKSHVLCLILGLSLAASGAQAAEVTLPYQALTLNANLELAEGKKIADGMILITHGGLAHNAMEVITYLQGLLKEKGYNSLAINLSFGVNNRHGMYDCKVPHRHLYTDAMNEIGAWMEWLQKQGVQRVALLGHSVGGSRTAMYAAERDSALVKAIVLLAPATRANSDAADFQRRFRKPLAPILAKAEKLVKEGKGNTVLPRTPLMTCADSPVTAASFVSHYGGDPRVDTPTLIPKLKKPTLVVVAGGDEIVVGLEKKVAPLVDGKQVQMKVVDSADHFFRDLYSDDAVDAIDVFLKGAGY